MVEINWKKTIAWTIAIAMLIITITGATASEADDILTYYTMDNADSNTTHIFDKANHFNGTLSGATRGASGKLNEATDYDGNDDWVKSIPATYLEAADNWTTCQWARNDGDSADSFTGLWGNLDAGNNGIMLYINDATEALTAWVDSAGHVTNTIITEGHLNHYCFVKNNTWYGVYINGTLTLNFTDAHDHSAQNLYVGMSYADGQGADGNSWNGIIDEFVFWSDAKTQEDIQNVYNLGAACPWDLTTCGVLNVTITGTDM